MRKFLLFLLFVFASLCGFSQPYGNEWINFSSHGFFSDQQYFKIQISNEGIYRISADSLIKAGIPVKTSANPANPIDVRFLQLFAKGVEQYIYLNDVTGGQFGPAGYVEFYGKGNDGSFDKSLYTDPNGQPNPRYSLFNDTAAYFLTWNNSLINHRATVETDVAFGPYTPLGYFFYESIKQYHNEYYDGDHDEVNSSDPDYIPGEGFTGPSYAITDVITTPVQFTPTGNPPSMYTPNVARSSGVLARLSTVVLGGSNDRNFNNDHKIKIKINSSTFLDSAFEGYLMVPVGKNVPLSDLIDGFNPMEFSTQWPLSPRPAADRNSVPFISIKYPHSLTFTGESATKYLMEVPDNPSQAKAYLDMVDFNDQGSTPVLYDLTNNRRIPVVKSGNINKALIPNSGGIKKCFLSSDGAVTNLLASEIRPIGSEVGGFARFVNYENDNADFIIITHKALLKGAGEYKAYRQQQGHKVRVAEIQDLYDQFAFGINRHPLSIRYFTEFALDKWTTTPPENLLLIGKSISPSDARNSAAYSALNAIPTLGYPTSDNLLLAFINGGKLSTAIPLGRLSARTDTEIEDYLNKVKEYENNEAGEWMKRAIHLGGGNGGPEQLGFANFLNIYKNTFEDSLFGGHVSTFLKEKTGPEINQSDSLKKLVESGVSLITFFGHSAPTIFDNSLDNPANYHNTPGRYPFFVAAGCYAGDVHFFDDKHPEVRSSSENYCLIKDKGSIGFWASSFLSVTQPLHNVVSEFYSNISRKYYGQSVGKAIQQAINVTQPSLPVQRSQLFQKEICLIMTLEGDPSIVLNAHPKPDIAISETSVSFSPANVTTDQNDFNVNVVMTNIGRTFRDSFYVEIKRKYGDNSDTTYLVRVPPVFYKDTLTLNLPVDPIKGPGLNQFEVFVDATNLLDEVWAKNPGGELNNKSTAKLLIKSNDLTPVYPIKYGIVSNNSVTLKAVTGNLFATSKLYEIEIDTSRSYNSPLRLATAITQIGGVVSWKPPVTLKDSTVYYWRARDTSQSKWSESSFIYIPDKKGWSQAHVGQFVNDKYSNIILDEPTRHFGFVNEIKSVRIETYNPLAARSEDEGYFINNIRMRNGSCAGYKTGGFSIAVYDPIQNTFWQSVPGASKYGEFICTSYPLDAFDFRTGSAYPSERAGIQSLLDAVPTGYCIIMYSIYNAHYSLLDPALKTAIRNLGSAAIDTLKDGQAFAFITRKGSGRFHEAVSADSSVIFLNDTILIHWLNGNIKSERIGPSSHWDKLKWRSHSVESAGISKDFSRLNVVGIKPDGRTEVTLIANLTKDSSVVDLSSRIKASDYPYLKLDAFLADSTLRTPPQMDKWQVFYDGVPEASLNPAKNFSFYKDTVQEGDVVKLMTAAENISDYSMDSLKVKMWFVDKNGATHDLFNKKRRPLLASGSVGDTLNISGAVNTLGYPGLNILWMEFNPDNDQREQYHVNDICNIPFYVKRDNANPLMDVTFDGVHILDGDIVSAKPRILISTKDENKFLALNDTTMFRVWIIPQGETNIDKNRLYFKESVNGANNGNLRFRPGSSSSNVAEIEYNPNFVKDGIYTLMVEGQDASKNESKKNYRTTFEVINKSTITGVMNYPNPFSTSTRFVFTLTGSELPSSFKIQIMTVSGKVVREIMLNELGPIHIGRNITDYAWDGKDEFGDKLANGLYIYRVVSSISGKEIEKRDTNADKYFVKGYGKMYLIR